MCWSACQLSALAVRSAARAAIAGEISDSFLARHLGDIGVAAESWLSRATAQRVEADAAAAAAATGLAHTAWHAFSNLQIALIVPFYGAFAIAAVRARNRFAHQRFMAMVHVLIAANFLPRVTAAVLRFFLPTFSGEENFSIACAIQWCMQLQQVSRSRLKPIFLTAIGLMAVLSILLIGFEVWAVHRGAPEAPVVTSTVGPAVAVAFGTLFFRHGKKIVGTEAYAVATEKVEKEEAKKSK
jgi:hypothetical protein